MLIISKKLFALYTVFALLFIVAGVFLGAASAKADTEDLWTCPSGISAVATADTSCPFADNVAQAWYNQPGNTVFAYSPVTDQVYKMTCAPAWTSGWGEAKRCMGFNASHVALVVYVD